jgi:hypothetical protein
MTSHTTPEEVAAPIAERAQDRDDGLDDDPDDRHAAEHPDQTGLRSRPSKTNCTSTTSGPETVDVPSDPGSKLTLRGQYWREKNDIVDRFINERPERAARPLSVRSSTTLRDEATFDGSNGEKARSWSDVLNEFASWYNDYRWSHLVMLDPDSNEVRVPLENSHQPQYGNRYYAKVKAFERQAMKEYDDLTVAMLTLTGSNRTEEGRWRCPADHMRQVVDSWRPDRGRGAYHTLRDVLDAETWEYALVVEKHKSGYAHVHVAVFVDSDDVCEADFRPVIDSHLRNCSIAHREAHDYHHPDDEKRPISVRSVDPDLDLNQPGEGDDLEAVANLGSYVGEYIGAHGESLFDRGLDELQFRAAAWASGTQLVRFSTGANEMIADDLDDDDLDDDSVTVDVPRVDPDPDWDGDGAPFEVSGQGWEVVSIANVDRDGETRHDLKNASVDWTNVVDAPHLDPPPDLSPATPTPRTEQTTMHGPE